MKTLSILLGVLLACASLPARAGSNNLWNAVFSLDKPGQHLEAENALMSAGKEGLDVLLKAARIGGERKALGYAADALGCRFFSTGPGIIHHFYGENKIPKQAAALAARMLSANSDLQGALLRSDNPFERKMAIVSLADNPVRLKELANSLSSETDASVIETLKGVMGCAALAALKNGDPGEKDVLWAMSRSLGKKREDMFPVNRCDGPGFAAGVILSKLLEGSYEAIGWSRSNDDLAIRIRRDDGGTSELSIGCALAVYDAAARKGKYLHRLIMPVVTAGGTGKEIRQLAATRALGDLMQYPEGKRNSIAAQLVNAGFRVDHRVTFEKDRPFAQEELIEAAARQGSPDARKTIDDAVFCRGSFGDKRIALLGFLGTSRAADTAAEIAERCPRALASATTALIRLEDERALRFLGAALEDMGFVEKKLTRAIEEHYSPAIDGALRKLAPSNHRARLLLRRLRKDGIAKP